jgi:uncharacterized protein (TIGR03067 family)
VKNTLLGFVAAFVFSAVPVWADDKKEEKKDEAAKIEGKWVATSYQRGGREVPKDMIKTELTITKGAYEFPTGINRISMKGTIAVDAAKGAIDFTPADGPSKGKTLLGIYKVEGDKLTICFGAAGKDRPKEFKTADPLIVLATYEKKK